MKKLVKKIMLKTYSGLMTDLTIKDFKSKYANSHLGLLWNVILPICYILIYTLIFSKLMMARLPHMTGTFDYSIYLSSGILAWTIFNNTLSRLQNVFLENANFVKKVYFPKIILLFSIVCSSLIELLINYSLLALILFIIGHPISISYLLIFPVVLMLQLFALGIGLIFCVCTIHFRDLTQIIPVLLQLWFWFTPIVYAKEIIPDNFKYLIEWNPLYYFINFLQRIIIFNNENNYSFDFLIISSITVVALILGSLIYRKLVTDVSDLI